MIMRPFHWCLCLLLCLFTILAVPLSAQFPMVVKAYWTPSVVDATHGVPDSYTLTINGGAPITVGTVVVNDANCPLASNPRGCVLTTPTITAPGQHQFCVVAVNQWGTSAPPACLTANINTPGTIVWVRITK